jgi:hypothetical protein
MFARIGVIIGLTLTMGAAAAQDSLTNPNFEHVLASRTEPPGDERRPSPSEPQSGALPAAILLPAPDPIGDITNARGPNSHQRLLVQYAVYASIGNRDGMQIILDQLRKLGVKREEVEDFVDRAEIHTGSPRQPERAVSQVEDAWKLSQ